MLARSSMEMCIRDSAKMIAAVGVLSADELAKMLDGLERIPYSAAEEAQKCVNQDVIAEAWKKHRPGIGAVGSAMPYVVTLNPHAEDIHHLSLIHI